MEKEIAVLIPIILFIVVGLVIVTAVFFRSREKQMLIEKGLPPEAIKEFYQEKRSPYILLKIGIIVLFFGFGLGFGLILEDWSGKDYWVTLLLFTITGLGIILANLIGRNLEKKDAIK